MIAYILKWHGIYKKKKKKKIEWLNVSKFMKFFTGVFLLKDAPQSGLLFYNNRCYIVNIVLLSRWSAERSICINLIIWVAFKNDFEKSIEKHPLGSN